MTSSSQGKGAEDGTLPVLYQHCLAVYEAMLQSSAKTTTIDGGVKQEAVVYEGFLTKLVTEQIHLSVPYYTSVMRALKKMGCCSQVRRGGSTSPSQWRLFHEPTEELFTSKVQKARNSPTSQHTTRLDTLEGNQIMLAKRVSEIEAILRNALDEGKEEQDVLPESTDKHAD